MFSCIHCPEKGEFDDLVYHNVRYHPSEILKIQKRELNSVTGVHGQRTLNFNVIPDIVQRTNKTIKPLTSEEKSTIEIIDLTDNDLNFSTLSIEESPCKSPFRKICRTCTPHKVAQDLFDINKHVTDSSEKLEVSPIQSEEEIEFEDEGSDCDTLMKELISYLPDVIDSLRNVGQLHNWLTFHRMVKDGRFPLHNIAFLLFMDVCKFFSDDSTRSMRYSPVVKSFWRIGYCLFHGKWLRFMSGPKHCGQNVFSNKFELIPEEAEINFAVPVRAIVNQSDIQKEVKPGILQQMVDKLSSQDSTLKTFKLCVDGKKINAGKGEKFGDIDLFGFEPSPTLAEKKIKLEQHTSLIKDITNILDDLLVRNKCRVDSVPLKEREQICQLLYQVLKIIGGKISELRKTKVKKEMTVEKLKKESGPDWRKSKFVFVISSLETDLYDISSTVSDLLQSSDEIGRIIAFFRGSETLYQSEKHVQLETQNNYVHLNENLSDNTNLELRFVKQGSSRWFSARNSAKVTGSTINEAVGLGSLKKQQQHFDKVIYKKETAVKQPECIIERMKYGSENEINAIATLVSKVLPVYAPSLMYFEEGCYEKSISDEMTSEVSVVVSPDGSVRNDLISPAIFGVECKCPFPGKSYTTPVYYSIPRYYVPQVLAEMFALDTDKLYFVCYSEESSTVFEVVFCKMLWESIEKMLINIYGTERPVRPTKKPPLNDIEKLIDSFLLENVTFLAELPSVMGIKCQRQTDRLVCIHTEEMPSRKPMSVKHVTESVRNVSVRLGKAYELNRTRASEFLGFMVSDLDREYSNEMCHAVPVAFGLKGYSMSTETLRRMIEFVLKECWSKGLYIPVCSFDGQWIRVATRDRRGKPLTMIQLQKDVYATAKKMSKGQIIKEIGEMNIVKCKSELELSQCVTLTRGGSKVTLSNGNRYSRIAVTGNLIPLLRSQKNIIDISDKDAEETEAENNTADLIVSALPENFQTEVEQCVLDEVIGIASLTNQNTHSPVDSMQGCEELNDETLNAVTAAFEEVTHEEMFIEETRLQESTLPVSHDPCETFLQTLNTNDRLRSMYEELKLKDGKFVMSYEQFEEAVRNSKAANKLFTKNQIVTMMSPLIGILKANGVKCNASQPKYLFLNILSTIFGNGEKVQPKKRTLHSPLSLSKLCKRAVQKIPKLALNCVYAQHTYPKALHIWQTESPFGRKMCIENVSDSLVSDWYSQPEFNDEIGSYLFMILDAYHQLCGLRRLFCSSEMCKAGISSKPLHYVAEHSEENGCGLSIALVRDMIDKQSVAYAVQTFSEKVESSLTEIGADNEAGFCKLVREWFLSEDEPGLTALERCEAKLRFRKWLLQHVRFDVFPPYGSYVNDIPLVLFEGLLTGIERKIQLYPFTKVGTYNVRAVGSLDIENFFSSFQDIDPKGTGVLRPDDIPSAIGVAMELLEARLDPERGFYMKTSKKRVYPVQEFSARQYGRVLNSDLVVDLSVIKLRDHVFDLLERIRGKPKRKSGKVSKPSQPSRNPFPVREHHRASEAKILPHVRRGLILESSDGQ